MHTPTRPARAHRSLSARALPLTLGLTLCLTLSLTLSLTLCLTLGLTARDALAEGQGGGALGGKGGSGPEPTSLALLATATAIGALVVRRRQDR